MGLFNFLDPILNFIFGPLLNLGYLPGLLIITLIISLLIVFIYKFTTDQARMKELKATIKQYQEKLKGLKDEPQKMMAEQKKMMSVNMELMKHSMKPTLYTFLPIIIIFGWLATHFAFMPIMPGDSFNVSATFDPDFTSDVNLIVGDGLSLTSPSNVQIVGGTASWTLTADQAGEYTVFLETGTQQFQKDILVSDSPGYVTNVLRPKTFIDSVYGRGDGYLPKESSIRLVTVSYQPVKPLPFSLFGWRPGWLGTYILFSILFSILLRKILKVA